jgi:hypothetical protein
VKELCGDNYVPKQNKKIGKPINASAQQNLEAQSA